MLGKKIEKILFTEFVQQFSAVAEKDFMKKVSVWNQDNEH